MSERSTERRTRVAAAMARCREILFEAFSAFAALIVSWRAVDSFDGEPVAPFTSSVLMAVANGLWFWALLICGFVQLWALAYGLATNNGYRIRAIVKVCAALIWTCVFGAGITAPAAISVAAGYGLMAVFSWIEALALMVRADVFIFGQIASTLAKEAECGRDERIF